MGIGRCRRLRLGCCVLVESRTDLQAAAFACCFVKRSRISQGRISRLSFCRALAFRQDGEKILRLRRAEGATSQCMGAKLLPAGG